MHRERYCIPALVLGLSLLFLCGSVVPAPADIYLAKTDNGSIVLTNTPHEEAAAHTFKLITRSDTSTNIDLPDAETLKTIVKKASGKHGVPEELVYAVIQVESDGETQARSHKGALGLMQLMPSTAEYLGVENPLDPRENIMGGTRYLKKLLSRFDGDLDRAMAAYNAGPGTVREHGGIPPYPETRQFVQRVNDRFKRFKSKEDMIYTYRDENGVLHVTNIR